jgi:hypothetical protein
MKQNQQKHGSITQKANQMNMRNGWGEKNGGVTLQTTDQPTQRGIDSMRVGGVEFKGKESI